MNYKKCTTITKDSNIVVTENRSSFRLKNFKKYKVEKIQVDGCLINDTRTRCDWILIVRKKESRALYIELKGSDIDKAIRQLESTLNLTKSKFIDQTHECFIVSTRVPKYEPSVQKLAKAFYNKNKATLVVTNIRATIDA